jgi:hypothetical protein
VHSSSSTFMRESRPTPAWRAAALSLALSISTTAVASAQVAGGSAVGVAVLVDLEQGGQAPGIFRGSREAAAAQSENTFRFRQGAASVDVLGPGSLWGVADAGVAAVPMATPILVLREDASIAPGVFMGPVALARLLHEELIATHGAAALPRGSLVLPESHLRVRAIELGSAVRN